MNNRNIKIVLQLSKNELEYIEKIAQQVQLPLEDLIILAIIALDRTDESHKQQ